MNNRGKYIDKRSEKNYNKVSREKKLNGVSENNFLQKYISSLIKVNKTLGSITSIIITQYIICINKSSVIKLLM